MTDLRPLPDAFILGAMRSGTTFLHAALEHHPSVAAANKKELQFFSLYWQKGIEHYRRQMPLRWPRWVYELACRPRPLVVDSSPYYLFHPEAPARLAATIGPSAKCIVLLREPVARAWSDYQFNLHRGLEHLGFREALAQEPQRSRIDQPPPNPQHPHLIAHQLYSYAARGLYAQQLCAWWQHIPRDRFLLLRSEDLFATPQLVFDHVCDFLGLARMPLPEGLPRNARSRFTMAEDLRAGLNQFYEGSNRDLYDLTGICWPPSQPSAQQAPTEDPCL